MTAQNPALYIQGANHPAEDFRHLITTGFGGREGVVRGGLAVTERSGTANMSVDVAEGTVAVAGTETTYQGLYLCHNRGVANLAISASDPTNARYDLVVAQVEDSDYSGATDAWKLDIVTGTPAATPLFPAVPDNAFVLATVLVPASASSIVNADITDIRDGSDTDGATTLINRGYAANPGVVVCTSTTRPSSPYLGMEIFETDTKAMRTWDGSAWLAQVSFTGDSAGSTRVVHWKGDVTVDGSGEATMNASTFGLTTISGAVAQRSWNADFATGFSVVCRVSGASSIQLRLMRLTGTTSGEYVRQGTTVDECYLIVWGT